MADYTGAIEMFVPDANVFPDRWGYTAKYLILHKTGGGDTAQGTAAWFQRGAGGARTSTHYVVGLDGEIVQCVREKDGAGGNGILEAGHDVFWDERINPNLITFSIESVDPSLTNATTMPQAQKDALFPLVKDICTRHNIPMRPADATGGITGHSSIAPGTRAHCPGNFAWDELYAFLGQQGDMVMGVPAGWSDDGTTLTDPEGHKVIRGFRDYILTHAWDKDDYAIDEEHAEHALELTNPSLGGGTAQNFRCTRLEWTPQTGVIKCYIGKEYLAYRKKAEASTTPIIGEAVNLLTTGLANITAARQKLIS